MNLFGIEVNGIWLIILFGWIVYMIIHFRVKSEKKDKNKIKQSGQKVEEDKMSVEQEEEQEEDGDITYSLTLYFDGGEGNEDIEETFESLSLEEAKELFDKIDLAIKNNEKTVTIEIPETSDIDYSKDLFMINKLIKVSIIKEE